MTEGQFQRVLGAKDQMPRPFRVARGLYVGYAALVLSLGIIAMYMPGSPAALIWPYEWLIVGGWGLLGLCFYLRTSRR